MHVKAEDTEAISLVYFTHIHVHKMKTKNKNQTRPCQLRTNDSVQEIRGCFEVTTWNVFRENCNDLAEIVDTATS